MESTIPIFLCEITQRIIIVSCNILLIVIITIWVIKYKIKNSVQKKKSEQAEQQFPTINIGLGKLSYEPVTHNICHPSMRHCNEWLVYPLVLMPLCITKNKRAHVYKAWKRQECRDNSDWLNLRRMINLRKKLNEF